MRGIQLKGLLCDTVGAEGLKANICLEMLVMQLIHACMHTHTHTHTLQLTLHCIGITPCHLCPQFANKRDDLIGLV